jgi:ApbE superfamily uncharacterized protein (UPF0280 family)
MEYTQRFYRDWVGRPDLAAFRVVQGESDLLILADEDLGRAAAGALARARTEVQDAIAARPGFLGALEPLDGDGAEPPLVRGMLAAGRAFGVGPMAAVAGAVAQDVALALRAHSKTVIVENGGDVFALAPGPVRFALYAGEESPFRGKVGFTVDASRGVGVCTSSGRVGPSLSFGRADAVVAIAPDAALADAAATSLSNRIQGPDDVEIVIEDERRRGRLTGAIAACGDRLGAFGELELFRFENGGTK